MPNHTSQDIFDEGEASSPTEKNLEKVLMKSDVIKEKIGSRGPLSRFIEDGRILLSLVRDFKSGLYRQIPYGTIAAVAFVLLYVFNPLDLLPDVIPFIGVLDDATILGACLVAIERDLFKYRNWKQEQGI
jgi:uncharacterized membrane protein YkvA (DUF1232 family)